MWHLFGVLAERLIALEIANPELRIVVQRFESSTLRFESPGDAGQNPASPVHIFCRLVAELVLHRSRKPASSDMGVRIPQTALK